MPRAGLDPATVTRAAADLADEIGLAQLSMSLVAERLDVRPPSLYKHVGGLDDLTRRVAVLAATEVGDELRDAIQGRSGGEALAAAAQSLRAYVKEHPGRYAATTVARPTSPDDPLTGALERTLVSFAAVLGDYRLDPADQIHALRMMRSFLHGFATLEAAGGFQIDTDVDASFAWLVEFMDRGLRASSAR
jgi:AcrR family transcriptional regulator